MEEVEVLIIGAGIVGLAIAERLSKTFDCVIVAEKEDSFGRHTSSRNSEVIHSGIYYPKNSLKAKLCVKGNDMLYDFMQKHDVHHRKCGKLLIAAKEQEIPILEELLQNGTNNGVQGLEIYSQEQVKEIEPLFKTMGALWVPSTGIMDTHNVMKKLEFLAEENGAMVSYNTEAVGIEKVDDSYIVTFKDGFQVKSPIVINSAGLWSDKVSGMVGIHPEKHNYKIHLCKGEYYKTTKYNNIEHLVYPVPDPTGISLGIHIRINLNGELSFGPNAYYVDELEYSMDETYHRLFHESVSEYLDIEFDEMWQDDAGIRPKLQGKGEGFRDFVIENEKDKGFPNFINLIGIESPGLTCCLAIAEFVENLIEH
ncbi:MAG: NAD(P)/FAD-dependent oxidoreductase [Candidatus Cloacimonetes bacterium]|nr:NAD(P)/FAD-dependent oxidoreductase [Candidatus Cloacimonadota bacterium]